MASQVGIKRCKDCATEGVTTPRPTPWPGPRCTTHHRVVRDARKARKHELHVVSNFGLSADDYQKIYAAQGGRCYGCGYATGKTRRLAVDHEHGKPGCDHPPDKGCYLCIRALLCGQCNQIIGRLGVPALRRLIEVLTDPPARKVLMSS